MASCASGKRNCSTGTPKNPTLPKAEARTVARFALPATERRTAALSAGSFVQASPSMNPSAMRAAESSGSSNLRRRMSHITKNTSACPARDTANIMARLTASCGE